MWELPGEGIPVDARVNQAARASTGPASIPRRPWAIRAPSGVATPLPQGAGRHPERAVAVGERGVDRGEVLAGDVEREGVGNAEVAETVRRAGDPAGRGVGAVDGMNGDFPRDRRGHPGKDREAGRETVTDLKRRGRQGRGFEVERLGDPHVEDRVERVAGAPDVGDGAGEADLVAPVLAELVGEVVGEGRELVDA